MAVKQFDGTLGDRIDDLKTNLELTKNLFHSITRILRKI